MCAVARDLLSSNEVQTFGFYFPANPLLKRILLRGIFEDYESVGGRNGAEDGSDGHVSRVRSDTYNSVILRKGEISREVRSYADIARENIGRPLGQ